LMTDGTREYNASNYRLSTFYDLAKTAVLRLAFAQAHELAPHGCTAVALTLAMFTQPALVVFDRQSGMHALRLSLQGCIENIGATAVFTVLGLIAAFCVYVLFVIVVQLGMLLGGPLAAAFIAQLVFTTVLMPLYVGAVYAAWKQMFVHRGSRGAPSVPQSPPANDVFHA